MKIPKNRNILLNNSNGWIDCENASCYLYAFNVYLNENLLVGELIGKRCNSQVSNFELIKTLKEEANFFGYEMKEIKAYDKINKEELKICLVRDERTGYYHFLRKTAEDELWSEKYPGELPNKTDFEGDDRFYYQDFRKRWYFKIRISNC